MLTTFTPIGQIKQMETRLELWAKVFEASSEGIVVMDAGGKILTINPSFCRSTSFEKHKLAGTDATLLLSECSVPDGRSGRLSAAGGPSHADAANRRQQRYAAHSQAPAMKAAPK